MKLNFLGDVYLDDIYKIDFELNDYIFNLEYPLSTKGIPAKGKVNLGVDRKECIIKTFGKNPVAVNLANNHIMDYGEKSFNETIQFLDTENIQYFGAGTKSNNFNNPLIINFNEKRIALFAYCCQSTSPIIGEVSTNGAAPIDINLIENDLAETIDVDFKIVNLHWGDEEIKYPKPSDIIKAEKIIDLGADLIIGHHSHVIQSIKKYKEKDIFFGIGNFLFPDLNEPSNFDGEKFNDKYIKKQSENNKYSIMLELEENFNIKKLITKFNKDTVIISKKQLFNYKLIKNKKIYDSYVKYTKKKGTIIRFLKKPKIPTLSQIKIFLGLNK